MKLSLLVSITIAIAASGADGLKCYNCTTSSLTTEDCSTKVTCPDVSGGETTACLKKSAGNTDKARIDWQKCIETWNLSTAGLATMRTCGLKSEAVNCDGAIGVCACTTDLCNTAVRPGIWTAPAMIVLAAFAIAIYNFA